MKYCDVLYAGSLMWGSVDVQQCSPYFNHCRIHNGSWNGINFNGEHLTIDSSSIKDCAKRGIHAVTIVSSGFREAGAEGAALAGDLIEVEIRDATSLWGRLTDETEAVLQRELGDERVSVTSIGPAGENLVRGSGILGDCGNAAAGCDTAIGPPRPWNSLSNVSLSSERRKYGSTSR